MQRNGSYISQVLPVTKVDLGVTDFNLSSVDVIVSDPDRSIAPRWIFSQLPEAHLVDCENMLADLSESHIYHRYTLYSQGFATLSDEIH